MTWREYSHKEQQQYLIRESKSTNKQEESLFMKLGKNTQTEVEKPAWSWLRHTCKLLWPWVKHDKCESTHRSPWFLCHSLGLASAETHILQHSFESHNYFTGHTVRFTHYIVAVFILELKAIGEHRPPPSSPFPKTTLCVFLPKEQIPAPPGWIICWS